MKSSSSKPPPHPHLRLHVDTTTATSNGSAASSGSESSSRSPRPSAAAAAAAGSGGGSGGGQNQACAACKYQRRKCNPDCPLAPYFPADQQRRFLNAHRLFGVSNIQKTLHKIAPEHGPEAMRALIFESDARALDPVGGCVTIIEELQRQIQHTELELAHVRQQIAIYRQAAAAPDPLAADQGMLLPAASAATAVAGQDNAVALDSLYAVQGPGLVFHDQQDYNVLKVHDQNHPPPQQQHCNYLCYDAASSGDEASSHDDVRMQKYQKYGFTNTGVKVGSPPVALGEQMKQHCKIEAGPFVDALSQDLPATAGHHGRPAGIMHRQEKAAAVKKHDIDQHMEEDDPGGAAAAPCHLELGFSSF